MAKKKNGGKKKGGGTKRRAHRKNPSRKHHHARRRRNPSNTFGSRLGKLAIGAAAVVASGVLTTFAMSKIQPGTALSMYGVPVVVGLAGVAMAGKMPMLGGGLALGAATPYVLPLASRAIAATQPTPATTAGALAAAYRRNALPMGAVNMGAVNMGAVSRYAIGV